jgi:hypothetical protein
VIVIGLMPASEVANHARTPHANFGSEGHQQVYDFQRGLGFEVPATREPQQWQELQIPRWCRIHQMKK